MADDADPYLVAVEQYLYWRELGLSNAAMLRAVGLAPRRDDAEITVRALTTAYSVCRLRLQTAA